MGVGERESDDDGDYDQCKTRDGTRTRQTSASQFVGGHSDVGRRSLLLVLYFMALPLLSLLTRIPLNASVGRLNGRQIP